MPSTRGDAEFSHVSVAKASTFNQSGNSLPGSRGSGDRHASTYRAQVIAGLLEQFDGVMGLEGVLVLAATNHLEAIDPALRRPGRIDRSLARPLPGRAAIRALVVRRVGDVLPDADLDDLARRGAGCSPAALDGALREARRGAGRDRRGADDLQRSRTAGSSAKCPWRSMAAASIGISGFNRLPQILSEASHSRIKASRTASS
ncbi:AAA family ATPase [Paracoccus beibuensis]|uniref:AAA family ATPase n=1 Tax=Paracoccus beibuensis TaxID=547602 RepID=UPI0038990DA6